MDIIKRFTRFYQNVDEQAVASLNEIYSDNIVFVDPVAKHQGISAVEDYFKNLLENTESCECEIQNILSNANKHMVKWEMNFTHPKLNAGQNVQVEGVTELHTDGDKIIYHRDFYDMGQMVYEQVPLLKTVVKSIKKRLSQ